jgi:D-alanine-D-alanine ligase
MTQRGATEVAVLHGGASAEREVSIKSGQAVAAALYDRGYDARLVDVTRDVPRLVKDLTPPPDVVFNALHGRFGEDGTVQGLLDLMGIPYTHSGRLASALAMDKPMARAVLEHADLLVPEGMVVACEAVRSEDPLPRPYVIKPLGEGSSVGVHIIRDDDDVGASIDGDSTLGEDVLVERFIPGRELTVTLMGARALGVTEIKPKHGFYDYRNKYTGGASEHRLPAPIHDDAYDAALEQALIAHEALGCRGVSRADLRYDDTNGEPGDLYVLEVNTQPGMTELSLVPEQAEHVGIGFGELVEWIVEEATCDG